MALAGTTSAGGAYDGSKADYAVRVRLDDGRGRLSDEPVRGENASRAQDHTAQFLDAHLIELKPRRGRALSRRRGGTG